MHCVMASRYSPVFRSGVHPRRGFFAGGASQLQRLPLYGIELPRQAKPIIDYAELFAPVVKPSLTDAERDMRPRGKPVFIIVTENCS